MGTQEEAAVSAVTVKKSDSGGGRPVVHVLFALFAISSWIDINGLWAELPNLVNSLAEGWDLPSYLVVIIQLANVAPAFFMIAYFCNAVPSRVVTPTIYIIITIGATACILLAFYWDKQTYWGGQLHSTALLVLCFFLAFVDCTSSVAYLAYVYVFPLPYLTSFFIGEGLSGLVPAVLALIQGVGGNPQCVTSIEVNTTWVNGTWVNVTTPHYSYYSSPPRFSTQVYFLLLFAIMVSSLLAFVLLNHHPVAKSEKLRERASGIYGQADGPEAKKEGSSGIYGQADGPASEPPKAKQEGSISSSMEMSSRESEPDTTSPMLPKARTNKLTACDYVLLLLMQAFVNGLTNGVLPSVQSYAALPYGNMAYHLAVTLALFANPTACCVVYWWPTTSRTLLLVLASLGTAVAGYIMWLALESPQPFLCGSPWGEVLVVVAWIVMTFLFTYVKVDICQLFRQDGVKALVWCGAAIQAGSLVGSLLTFPFVNIFKVFQPNDPCGQTCY